MDDFLPQGIPVHCEPQQIFLGRHRETGEFIVTCDRKDLRTEYQDLTDDPDVQTEFVACAEELGEYLLLPHLCSRIQKVLNATVRATKRRVLQWPD